MFRLKIFAILVVFLGLTTGLAQAACLGKDTGDFGSGDQCGLHPYYEKHSREGSAPASPSPSPDPEPEPEAEPGTDL